MSDCICGDMPPGGIWPAGEAPPKGCPVHDRLYSVVLADPPWKYGDKLRMSDVKRSAEDVYRTVMTTEEICAMASHYAYGAELGADVAARKEWQNVANLSIMGHRINNIAVLFLWVTNPFLLNGDGMRVCRAWGFEPKQLWTWVKGEIRDDAVVGTLGMGHYLRVDTEHLILATRGRATGLIQDHGLRNYTIVAPKGQHSEKPEEAYQMIEQLTSGHRLELFARRRREHWSAVGDEL